MAAVVDTPVEEDMTVDKVVETLASGAINKLLFRWTMFFLNLSTFEKKKSVLERFQQNYVVW